MLCAPIISQTALDDQTIAFAASIPIADNPLGADLEETLRVYTDGGPLREMGDRAAGRVDKVTVSDGRVTVTGRIVDPSSIAKVKWGVLKGVTIARRFISLTDRLDAAAEIDFIKGVFWSTLSNEMRKAMASDYDHEEDHNPERRMNAVNPAALTEMNEVDIDAITRSRNPDLSRAPGELQPDASFNAMRDGKPGSAPDPRDAFRQVFAQPHFGNLMDLRDRIPPPADIWRELITSGGNVLRDEILRPARGNRMLKSNSDATQRPQEPDAGRRVRTPPPVDSGAQRIRKAAQSALAAAYDGPAYRMLRSNG